MSLIRKFQGSVLVTAAAAGVLAGAAAAHASAVPDAAPHHGVTAPPDVGTPDEVTPNAPVIAPDGTRITPHDLDRAASKALAQSGWDMVNTVEFKVDGARIRSWVPSGPVVALAYRGNKAAAACQIPSGGYNWDFVRFNGRYGWVRNDLVTIIYQASGPWGSLPWCP